MIVGQKRWKSPAKETALKSIGFFRSGPGGAPYPAVIEKDQLLFELITEGAVYNPSGNTLHGVGTVFLHRQGQETVSRTEGDGFYACRTACFHRDWASPPVDWPRHFAWEDGDQAISFAEEMLEAFHHTEQDRQVIGDLVWSRFRYQLDLYRRRPSGRDIPPRLAAVLAHIESHYVEPLGVDALASRIGLSASHLHAEFRQYLGITPHQHLINHRMRSARHKLATTGEPIKSVAEAVGYANPENFCRAFKKYSGLSAAAYRKKYRTYEG